MYQTVLGIETNMEPGLRHPHSIRAVGSTL